MGNIVTIVGNRPQFIKMLPVSKALNARGYREIVVHTGQHYDDKLNDIFFRELDLPTPDIQLTTTKRTHGAMTGELLEKLEEVFLQLKPSHIMLYGDTNSTLAATLAAVKLHIQVAHIEAGPRMGDLRLPEEVNRITVDHLSQLLFCPDAPSVEHLKRENITKGVYLTGDVMLDAFNLTAPRAAKEATIMQNPRLKQAEFVFMTMHRPSNVDTKECLQKILQMIRACPHTVLFPAHLRTLARLVEFGLKAEFDALPNLILCEPLGYLDTVAALTACHMVITDSGGLQKEAYYAGKPAIVFLDETPWPDLKQSGWQRVMGIIPEASLDAVAAALSHYPIPTEAPAFYGNGKAAEIIVTQLEAHGFLNQKMMLKAA